MVRENHGRETVPIGSLDEAIPILGVNQFIRVDISDDISLDLRAKESQT